MKINIELKIKSCFPEEQTLEEQVDKVREEYLEMLEAEDRADIAEESLHIATTAVGLAQIAITEAAETGEINIPCYNKCMTNERWLSLIQKLLQKWIDKRYEEKQIDFAEGRG